jgi:hypothetical protein
VGGGDRLDGHRLSGNMLAVQRKGLPVLAVCHGAGKCMQKRGDCRSH